MLRQALKKGGMRIDLFLEARLASCLTQSQLASRVKVSANYISAIERQRITPPFVTADRIAKELDVPVERLFNCYVRRSVLPTFKDLMYLYNKGYDISPYEVESI